MGLSPKMKDAGEARLTTIQQWRNAATSPPAPAATAAAAVNVKHSRPPGSAWAVAETANFRIFHNQEPAYAEKVARVAEATRAAMQTKWFGKVEPAWKLRCDIYLHASAEAYSQATRAQTNVPGHSNISHVGSTVTGREMHLHVDVLGLLTEVLPHETTHIVLAGRFGPFDVPRWADEGMAVLTEPPERLERYRRTLPSFRDAGQLFTVRQLMAIEEGWPEAHRISAFYAQSMSLVEYLCELRGPQAFAHFLSEAMRGGAEPALKKHFGLEGYQELERRWMLRTFREGVARRQ
jgi:hypothetical protein